MNEVSNQYDDNHYNMQQLMDLMGQQMVNVTAMSRTVGNLSKAVDEVKNDVGVIKERMDTIEFKEEITYEQQNAIDSAVSISVYKLLGIGTNPSKWTVDERTINEKYGKIFRRRLRKEVTNKGHLAYPYRTTHKGNFVDAIKDIEAWTPRNGIAGLMKEADDNALARKIAREQGY